MLAVQHSTVLYFFVFICTPKARCPFGPSCSKASRVVGVAVFDAFKHSHLRQKGNLCTHEPQYLAPETQAACHSPVRKNVLNQLHELPEISLRALCARTARAPQTPPHLAIKFHRFAQEIRTVTAVVVVVGGCCLAQTLLRCSMCMTCSSAGRPCACQDEGQRPYLCGRELKSCWPLDAQILASVRRGIAAVFD